ncbi:MAG: hypothetical protein A2381_15240 [Bdellovibrionales bacterium RIFOXYB1_FULL_37_110]|nr:MAG: hypothetical protein A2381_15240 [Bdellovibrionales bacterium RIFOXYB1_FULL_37_110]
MNTSDHKQLLETISRLLEEFETKHSTVIGCFLDLETGERSPDSIISQSLWYEWGGKAFNPCPSWRLEKVRKA